MTKLPVMIPRTDEDDIERNTWLLDIFRDYSADITLKLDGSSMTVANLGYKVVVCSCNRVADQDSYYYEVAEKYGLFDILRHYPYMALQGELVGEKVQGNPLGLEGRSFFVFDIFDAAVSEYYTHSDVQWFAQRHNIPVVPYITHIPSFNLDLDGLLSLASTLEYNNGTPAEGMVVRRVPPAIHPRIGRISFKVMNPEYGSHH